MKEYYSTIYKSLQLLCDFGLLGYLFVNGREKLFYDVATEDTG